MPYCLGYAYCVKVREGFLGLIFLPFFASIPHSILSLPFSLNLHTIEYLLREEGEMYEYHGVFFIIV
jgi:hypothetical protein